MKKAKLPSSQRRSLASRQARKRPIICAIGKSPGFAFAYVPLDVAKSEGILQKAGIEIEIIAFDGASKMDLGMISGSVDITIGGPTEMAAIAKGMPAKARRGYRPPGARACDYRAL